MELAITIAEQQPPRIFRFVILSAPDVGLPQTQKRLDRLYHLDGGDNAGIIFFLDEGSPASETAHARLTFDTDMPVLPFTAFERLPEVLRNFAEGLTLGSAIAQEQKAARNWPPLGLLQHCAVEQPLGQHTVNVLSELSTGIKDLAEKMETVEGQRTILQYLLNTEEAMNFATFFRDDYQVG